MTVAENETLRELCQRYETEGRKIQKYTRETWNRAVSKCVKDSYSMHVIVLAMLFAENPDVSMKQLVNTLHPYTTATQSVFAKGHAISLLDANVLESWDAFND